MLDLKNQLRELVRPLLQSMRGELPSLHSGTSFSGGAFAPPEF